MPNKPYDQLEAGRDDEAAAEITRLRASLSTLRQECAVVLKPFAEKGKGYNSRQADLAFEGRRPTGHCFSINALWRAASFRARLLKDQSQ